MNTEHRAPLLANGTPPCRVCNKTTDIICYPDDLCQAICPACCDTAQHADGETGHVWKYDYDERTEACEKCGIDIKCTEYVHGYYDYDLS